MNTNSISISTTSPQTSFEWQTLHREHVTELRRRYDELFRRMSTLEAIVIHSGSPLLKNSADDQDWPTVTTPHFAHWTPYRETPALLVICPSERPRLYCQRHTSFWEGPAPRSDQWDRSSFDIEEVASLREITSFGACIFIGDDESYRPLTAIKDQTVSDVLRQLAVIRTTKTAFEVASMREASRIGGLGHKTLKDLFLSGGAFSELDLHYEYLKATQQTDFSVPYSNIVGMGSNAAILHHIHYSRKKRSGDLSLLVDAGATCNGLASDITRTWVRGTSKGATLFRQLVDGVERVQQALCQKFVVGTAYEALHNESHLLLADVLREIGLTKTSTEELVSSGATRCLFPHGLGHSLGIQVHDVGMKFRAAAQENPYLRNTSVIQAGQVVTVEPGIYFIDSLLKELSEKPVGKTFDWGAIELLKPYGGVRIEDNIHATKQGPENLTRVYI